MTCMINLSGRAINAKKFQEVFRDIIPVTSSSIKKRGGVGFAISDDSLVMLHQQIQPALTFLQNHKTEIQKMLSFDGVESASIDFGIRIDIEKIIFNINNFLPLELLRLATEIGINIELSFYFGSELMSRSADPKKTAQVECTVTFLSPEEGGRAKSLPPGTLSGGVYRPHLVVDDPKLRKEVAVNGHTVAEIYLGVAFNQGPRRIKAGETFTALLDLIYYPQLSYEGLQPGALFTVREGPQIVAYGTILTRSHGLL